MTRILIAACVIAGCGSGPDVPTGDGVVITDAGAVRGVHEGGVMAWYGVPYAAPPLGELRFAAPAPVAPWDGVRDAAAWSSGCVEITTGGVLIGGSEDCLYLNVWAPAEVSAPLPVLVFIHGGFQLSGSASHVAAGERVYAGAYVAEHGPAVFVSINYRLGALGFYAGNHALADQIAALAWVQTNIAAFGGDPQHVLVFGESAGGAATCALYASPRAAGLFSAALIESGGCVAKDADRAAALDAALVTGAGCDGAADVLACLRAVPADDLAVAAPIDLTVVGGDRWGLAIDGDLVPESPADAIIGGRQNAVPLIAGTTADEYSTLIRNFLAAPITTDAEYVATIQAFFPPVAATVLARYPSADYATPMAALIRVMTDAHMACPTRRLARAAATTSGAPLRRYLFAHTYSNGPNVPFGAGHAMDVPFELHNLGLDGFTPSATELALSDQIIGYWVRFAATGDPNGAGAPSWPVYDTATDPAIVLDDTVTATPGAGMAACDFWDSLSG